MILSTVILPNIFLLIIPILFLIPTALVLILEIYYLKIIILIEQRLKVLTLLIVILMTLSPELTQLRL